MRTLNLGILAHVDAGKTTLTERLLYAAGVIDEIGSVDDGSTQTDTLALERERGITIKSAVVSFVVDDVTVNLIDTPGHPDIIAEVERVLNVLDGAVLVVSAVEGVQAQTRVLMRTLQRLRIPTLMFVNKIDRGGAQDEAVLQDISEKLTPTIIAMGSTRDLGTRSSDFTPYGAADSAFAARLADVLAERDEALLAAYVDDQRSVRYPQLRGELVVQTKQALVHPIFFGSAITGAGVDSLMAGIAELLPAAEGDIDGPVSGSVFKVDRGPHGERIAYVRMFSGTIRTRDRLDNTRKVTAIRVFNRGAAVECGAIGARQIGQLWGLGDIQIGDVIGTPPKLSYQRRHFAPPTLETVVAPRRIADKGALRVALDQLAEQDPLINVRQDDTRQELSVSLYGEVQKEVIQATLSNDFGIDVSFRETTTIYIERAVGTGEAVEFLQSETHPFSATIGLRIEPAAPESGLQFRLDVDPRLLPMHIYKTRDRFVEAMTQYVSHTLREGLFGWQVTDCVVTMTECGYYASDGPTKPVSPTPRTTAADYRKLTPLVLMLALERATTVVCEPIMRVDIEIPTDTVGATLAAATRLGEIAGTASRRGNLSAIETLLPVARAQDLRRRLPGLTGGEGVVETTFGGYQPVRGAPPKRRRLMTNPLDRDTYLARVAGHASRPTNEHRE
ncbi:MAG: ribosomal protection tetracycline resistance protein [Actinomycetota bacterium]|nr:ribosomal protection tetracycline resistance protein [Actinomycetota bacterium]